MMLIVLVALAFISSQGAATTIAARNHSEEVSEAESDAVCHLLQPHLQGKDPVPTTLLACHAPYHPLPEPIYDVNPALEKYPLDFLPPSLRTEFENQADGWMMSLDEKVAFIDIATGPDDVMPRKLKEYMKDKPAVQYELPDHTTVERDERDEYDDRNGKWLWRYTASYYPMPHFWQVDLVSHRQVREVSHRQVKAAHNNLGLPANHFTRVILVHCPTGIFLYAPDLPGEVENYEYRPDRPDPELLRALKVSYEDAAKWGSKLRPIRLFWNNLRSLIAPGGKVVIDSLPGSVFAGKACDCSDPSTNPYARFGSNAPHRSCKRHERLHTDICWGNDALREPFDRAIGVFESMDFDLVGPQFDQGELGIVLQPIQRKTAVQQVEEKSPKRAEKRAASSESEVSKQRKLEH
ncbi:unnamed protein product [Vitrella brassicaformis CCMP3155]|uniref:Methyltransferase n=2 Tax=Vitrella brassicaformis TaxID=1169539 RepID=A0A0G4EBE0_VITBC|nr:unnamed protein product [Vitrella brassicaformis CCMP3155]|eukprot:CEL92591.1 unnamed protein product [Vitrella brassicaformis CCMP3155]